MPGLSNDPAKRQRQLDALRSGRRAMAQRLLAADDSEGTPAPASKGTAETGTSSEPPASGPVSAPGISNRPETAAPVGAGGALDVPVHTYGPAPEPPKRPEPEALPFTPEQEAMTPTTPKPRAVRGFLEGLRNGI